MAKNRRLLRIWGKLDLGILKWIGLEMRWGIAEQLRAPSSVVGSTVGTVEEEEAATKHTKGRVHTVVHRSTG